MNRRQALSLLAAAVAAQLPWPEPEPRLTLVMIRTLRRQLDTVKQQGDAYAVVPDSLLAELKAQQEAIYDTTGVLQGMLGRLGGATIIEYNPHTQTTRLAW